MGPFGPQLASLLAALIEAWGPEGLAGAAQVPRIHQGTAVGICGWPTTVAVVGGGGLCTGTLVHPQVVVYAAHCGGGNKSIRFGESSNNPGKTSAIEFCATNANYSYQGDDWAVCKLAAPVSLPVTPPVFGCELDLLEAGQSVAIVGFGMNSDNGGAGIKRWAWTENNGVDFDANIVGLGGFGNSGICSGDSGGPGFLAYEDGTWHTISIASTNQGSCGSPGTSSLIAGGVEWFEAQSGIDITPCHDLDGTWNPTAGCQGFLSGDGASGSGSWASWCAGTPAGGHSATCGAGFDQGGDQTAPVVQVLAPADQAQFPGPCVDLDIEIGATDDSGIVKTVGLTIDDDDQGVVLEDPPFVVEQVAFCEGTFEIRGTATDWSKNVGVSAPVVITVGDPGETDGGTEETTETGAGAGETDETTTETGTGGEADEGTTEADAGETAPGETEDGAVTAGSTADGGDAGGCGCATALASGSMWPWVLLVCPGVRRRRAADRV